MDDELIKRAEVFLDRDDSWHVALIDGTSLFDAIVQIMVGFAEQERKKVRYGDNTRAN